MLDPGDRFGRALAYLGDLDGPGPSTIALAVGAPGDDDGLPEFTWIQDPVGGHWYRVTTTRYYGRRVRKLEASPGGGGRVSVQWDGRGEGGAEVAEGVYFVKWVSEDQSGTARMIRLK